MKIDKTRFLLLTASLSATTVACLAFAVGCSTTPDETPPDLELPTRPDAKGETEDKDAGGGLGVDAAPTCLGDRGPAPTCSAGDPGASVAACGSACAQAVALFKVDVAKNVSDCLDTTLGSPAAEGDCSAAAPKCVAAALALACDDDSARTYCEGILADCREASDGGDARIPPQTSCEQIVRALTDKGRTNLTSCITEGAGTGCLLDRAGSCFRNIGRL